MSRAPLTTLAATIMCVAQLAIVTPTLTQAQEVELPEKKIEDATWFTMMPMFAAEDSFANQTAAVSYNSLLQAMTIDHGYEALCANVEWNMTTEMFGELSKFFGETAAQQNLTTLGGSHLFKATDPYMVDFSRARIPMWRGMEAKEKTLKNSSLEGMFGANNRQDDIPAEINRYGAAYNLLSTYEQCIYKAQNARTVGGVCSLQKKPGVKCEINSEYAVDIIVDQQGNSRSAKTGLPQAGEKLESVGFSVSEIPQLLRDLRPELDEEEAIQQACADITSGNPLENGQDPIQVARVRAAVDRVGIDIPNLYRLAFLVLVPGQNMKDEVANDKFNFLNAVNPVNKKYHSPIYIAFKIPDFGTNKSKTFNNVDTLELTKRVLQTAEQNERDISEQGTKRTELLANATYAGKQAAANNLDDLVVRCPTDYPQCDRRSQNNVVRNVVMDIVNGTRPKLKCGAETISMIVSGLGEGANPVEAIFNHPDLNWEKAGDIFTPATKDLANKEYHFKAAVNHIVQNQLTDYGFNDFKWELLVDKPEVPDFGDPIIVNVYIVAPIGETLKDVNKSFSIFWTADDFIDMMLKNVIIDMENKQGAIPKFYTIPGGVMGMNSTDRLNLNDECRQETGTNRVTGLTETRIVCEKYEVGARVKGSGEAFYPDFGLGWLMRKLQLVVRATFEPSYNYIRSCNRVEDMFLGRCDGDPEGDSELLAACSPEAFNNIKGIPTANEVIEQARDYFTANIGPKITPELMEAYAYAEEQTGIPCAVVAGIHWTEGGMDPNKSVFDGGALRGTLKEDAKLAMEHLISKFVSGFDPENIDYQKLVEAISYYNGIGNNNCDFDTRWKSGGKCPRQFVGDDHPHPINWISSRHTSMDLMYCIDFVQFACNVKWNDAAAKQLRDDLNEKAKWGALPQSRVEQLVQEASVKCYEGSPVCQQFGYGGKYIKYERPGSLTVAVLLNSFIPAK